MAIFLGTWKAVRGISLLAVLGIIFFAVLLLSCLARLVYGNALPDSAGRMRQGA